MPRGPLATNQHSHNKGITKGLTEALGRNDGVEPVATLPDDAAAQLHVARAVWEEPQAIKLPVAIFGVFRQEA